MTTRKPHPRSRSLARQLGGWDLDDKVRDPRDLWKVTIKTSIENWNEYILARNRAEVDAWLAGRAPVNGGWCKGYEPDVVQLNWMLDSIWQTR